MQELHDKALTEHDALFEDVMISPSYAVLVNMINGAFPYGHVGQPHASAVALNCCLTRLMFDSTSSINKQQLHSGLPSIIQQPAKLCAGIHTCMRALTRRCEHALYCDRLAIGCTKWYICQVPAHACRAWKASEGKQSSLELQAAYSVVPFRMGKHSCRGMSEATAQSPSAYCAYNMLATLEAMVTDNTSPTSPDSHLRRCQQEYESVAAELSHGHDLCEEAAGTSGGASNSTIAPKWSIAASA